MGVRKMKAQLTAMESRVGGLEEQLDTATRSVREQTLCVGIAMDFPVFIGRGKAKGTALKPEIPTKSIQSNAISL